MSPCGLWVRVERNEGQMKPGGKVNACSREKGDRNGGMKSNRSEIMASRA